jgi:hypothetical protein
MASSIGCDAKVLYDSRIVEQPKHKYIGTCLGGHPHAAHRRNKSACGVCCRIHNGGRFTEKYLIKWEEA